MFNKHVLQHPTTRHSIRVVAIVVFCVSLIALLMLEMYPRLLITRVVTETNDVEVTDDQASSTASQVGGLTREMPTILTIPALSLEASFESPLGLHADGTIEVPKQYDTVGWYKLGAAPGEVGTAAILGHVDSREGAAVFYHLGQLMPGDLVYVTRRDGTVATFAVEYLERYEQVAFPTEKVYAPTPYPSLRLITCSGIYDRETLRYTHNTVVYARYVDRDTVVGE